MGSLRLAAALLAALAAGSSLASPCTGRGIELQVLGSGGPETQGRRASSSYLVRQDGAARVLVDAGGGSALRFGEARARMADLHAILLTHLHADHAADLPALVKSSFFEGRDRALQVLGPTGNERFPSTMGFVRALFDARRGAFRYLSGFLDGEGESYRLVPRSVSLLPGQARTISLGAGWTATAAPVVHGRVPALAWRVDVAGVRIAFSGDTNGEGGLEALARGADLLVAHEAVPEGATGVERFLHMPPSVIGRIAAAAGVKRVVLSHRMLRTLGRDEEARRAIAGVYAGPVAFADDLDCFAP